MRFRRPLLGCLALGFGTAAQVFKGHGQNRNQHNNDRKHLNIVVDELDTTQQHACHANRTNPQDGTQDVPEVEPAARIRRNTRRQRNEGTNDRYEATYNKRETASFSKKFFRSVQVLGAQDFCIVFEKITAIAGTQLIPDLAASYRRNDKNRER